MIKMLSISLEILLFPFGVMIEEDWPSKIWGFLLLICYICILSVLFSWSVMLADNVGQPVKTSMGTVMDKKFIPAHSKRRIVGKIITRRRIPDAWAIKVRIDGKTDSIAVKKDFYDSVNESNQICACYVIGRITGSLYLRDVHK